MPPINVLYVDDEEDLLEIGKRYLELNSDLHIVTVSSALGALAELKASKFEAVVADYQMPGMNGIELLKQIRVHSQIPFILFTGKGREEVVIEALNSGADFYLQKGGGFKAQFAELEHKIKEAVRKRRTEQALDESEVKFQKVFNNSNDAIFIINSEGRFIDVNSIACRELGYSREELLQLSPLDITMPEFAVRVSDHVRETLEKGSGVFETVHLTKDGAEIPIELTTQLFIHEGNTGIMGVARNISERRKAEDALRASEERFRVLFETANDGIILIDNLKIIDCNSKALELFGCSSKQDIIGHDPGEFSPESQPDGSNSKISGMERTRAALEGKPQRFNWLHLRKDGTPFHVEVALSAFTLRGQTYVEAIVRDISRRRGMLEELNRTSEDAEVRFKHSESTFQTIAENTKDVIWKLDTRTLRFTYVSPSVRSLRGITVTEAMSESLKDSVDPSSYDKILKLLPLRIQQLRDGNEEVRSRTDVVQQKRKDGSWVTVEVVTTMITDENNEVIEILGVSRDATDRRKAEAIQSALYLIAHATNSTIGLGELFASIHGTLKELMPAQNFFIALYDGESDELSYPYFVDEFDPTPMPHKPDKGLTAYVLSTGQPLLASPEVFEGLVKKGEVDLLGAPSLDWLGVPLRIAGRTIGVMATQSYAEGVRLGESDMQVMEFISDQVAMAIERKEAESAQARAQEALRSANKKLSLLSSITRHDILNQVAALRGYIDLSKMSLDDPAKLRGYLEKERKATLTIEHHISFTKDYEDMGMKSPCWQNLELIFRMATKQLPMGTIRLEIDTGNLEVYADPLLEKAFYNLVDNSLKYGGPELCCMKVRALGIGPDLMIVFEDDGAGIQDVDRGNLLHYGFGRHTGLGLFLSREILSITGLTIQEGSEPGHGARFEIVVPQGAFRGWRPSSDDPDYQAFSGTNDVGSGH
jgi:PAS domain S-box-containing protein